MKRLGLLLGLVLAGLGLLAYPLTLLPALTSLAAAALCWYRPVAVFALVPALLPLLDLAPWSGWTMVEDYDLLLLALLPLVAWRAPVQADPAPPPGWRLYLLLMVVLVLGAAWPLWSTTAAAWAPQRLLTANEMSAFNGLRILKGGLWAGGLLLLARRFEPAAVRESFGRGMVLGLAATVLLIVLERLLFTGLLDLSSDFRVTGPFAAMHTGGAYVECYLIAGLPFVLERLLRRGPLAGRGLALLLLLASAYSLFVTFSRAAYAAFVLTALLAVLAQAALSRRRRQLALVGVGLLGLAGLVLAGLPGSFAGARLQQVAGDVGTRWAHWQRTLAAVDGAALWRGHGLGSFARVLNGQGGLPVSQRSADFEWAADAAQAWLRLKPGLPVYVEQMVRLDPQQGYQLTLKARAAPGSVETGHLAIDLCQKWQLYSRNCQSQVLVLQPLAGWTELTRVYPPGLPSGQPLKLSFSQAGTAAVELSEVRLIGVLGDAPLANGSFASGLDRWSFSSDDHLAWHAKSLPVGLLFDLGLLGLSVWLAWLGWVLRSHGRAWLQGASWPASAALAGVLFIGLFDTLLDSPRFLMLLLLLAMLGQGRPGPARG